MSGGEWGLSAFKRDPAYGDPIILGWGGGDTTRFHPRAWLLRMREEPQRFVAKELDYCEHYQENTRRLLERTNRSLDAAKREKQQQRRGTGGRSDKQVARCDRLRTIG